VWVGLDNYAALFASSRFLRSLQNTVVFVVLGMGIGPTLGLASALLLNNRVRFRAFLRSAYFLPTMTSLVVVATIWKMLYQEQGLLNTFLGFFGLPAHAWLADPTTALPAVVAASVWQGFGFETVVFLAALQAIPREYYDAAKVDGADAWAQFRYVTLPGLRPTILFIYVIGIIGSFQVFDQIFVMTLGGPVQATRTLVFHLYDRFNSLDLGTASAVAYILLLILAVLSYIQFRLFEGRE
jgi:ABC-type sugar transport system permease subunit